MGIMGNGKLNLLITGNFVLPDPIRNRLSKKFSISHIRDITSYDRLRSELSVADFYILGGPEYLDQTLLSAATRLKKIVVMGTGIPSFLDYDFAKQRGIEIGNTPHLNCSAVAEFALGSLIAHSIPMVESIAMVRSGESWLQPIRKGLNNSRIGIIGLGNIGIALVERLRAIAPNSVISYWSRNRKPEAEKIYRISFRDLDCLFSECDLISTHISYCDETHEMIGVDLFEGASNDMRFFNFSNPRVVDAKALREWLMRESGPFAFFDGYYREWIFNMGLSDDHERLLDLPQTKFLATSHLAALEEDALGRIVLAAEQELIRE